MKTSVLILVCFFLLHSPASDSTVAMTGILACLYYEVYCCSGSDHIQIFKGGDKW